MRSSSYTGRKSSLYLHACHGTSATEVSTVMLSLIMTGRELSPAQAFVAMCWGSGQPCPDVAKMDEDDQVGISCEMVGLEMCMRTNEGSSTAFSSLLLAEVSCAVVVAGLTLVAMIPQKASSRSSDGVAGWFMFWCGRESHLQILDIMAEAGCLRRDFPLAFPERSTDKTIGQGAYASVHCMERWDGTALAVKRFNLTVQGALVQREMATLMQVQSHENIVAVRGLFLQPEGETIRYSLVFEIALCDLLTLISKSKPLIERGARPLFQGIQRGLAHIHSFSIVHRDIKTENILIDARGVAVIADFGLATWLSDEEQMKKRCGSPGYVAPEMCLGLRYGCKVDVFGAGVLLYFMLSKEMPFSNLDMDATSILKKTVACQLHLRRAPWDSLSSPLRKMLRATICKSASDRLSAVEALRHAWMQESCLPGDSMGIHDGHGPFSGGYPEQGTRPEAGDIVIAGVATDDSVGYNGVD